MQAKQELDVLNSNDATSAFTALAQAEEIQEKVEKQADDIEKEDAEKVEKNFAEL